MRKAQPTTQPTLNTMDVYVQPSTFVKERQSHAQIASLLQSLRPTTHVSNNQCHVMVTPRRACASTACAEERARATEANARLDEVLQADEHKENRAASTIEAGDVAATLASVLTELHRVKDELRGTTERHEMRMRQMEDDLLQMEDDLCQMKDGLRHTTAHGQATEARLRQTESIMFTEMADARLYAVARHAALTVPRDNSVAYAFPHQSHGVCGRCTRHVAIGVSRCTKHTARHKSSYLRTRALDDVRYSSRACG